MKNNHLTHCPSCRSKDISSLGDIPHGWYFAGQNLDCPLPGGRLYKCRNCYLFFRWPRMSESQMNQLYKGAYAKKWEFDINNRKDLQLSIEFLQKYNVSGKILDVGCFNGGFLRYLDGIWDKYGIEINSTAAERASKAGIKILGGDWQDINKFKQSFDVIVATDIIEHTKDPFQFLLSLVKVMKNDGYLIITSGNTNAFSWRIMRGRYWYCAIAEHISFINNKWCYSVAKKLNLQVIEIFRFSHSGKTKFKNKISETIYNLLYRTHPSAYSFVMRLRSYMAMRHNSYTGKELRRDYPNWSTAKDHIFVVFKKT